MELGPGEAYRIDSRVRENAALAEAIDRLPTGVILVDARGQRMLSNRAADSILELDDGKQRRFGLRSSPLGETES